MRILQVIDSLGRGGAERVVVTLATGQSRAHEVRLACLHDETDLAEELRGRGVEVTVMRTRPRDFVASAWSLSDLARDWRPQIVHAHLLDATLAVGLARLGTARRVATFHNLGLAGGQPGGLRTRIARVGLSAVCGRRFDVLTGVTLAASLAYRSELQLGSVPLVVNNPIDVQAIERLTPGSRAAARARMAPRSLRPLLVCVAKLTWEKSHQTLLKALAALPADRRPLAIMVGDGPRRPELVAETAALGLGNFVEWRGALPPAEVYSWIRAADVSVLASVSEGQPVTVLESMALGTPVVATRVGGIPDLLGTDRGWLVSPSRSEELADTLAAVIHDSDERERRASAARTFVEGAFSLDKVLSQWDALYG